MRRFVTCMALAALAAPALTQPRAAWEPIGISGGGGMFSPAISPADPKVMMINCDMSGAYVTTDGGRNWRMIDQAELRSNTDCRPAFHPTDPNVVYAADGWRGLKVSRDRGVHWTRIGNVPGDLQGEIAIDPGSPSRMLAGAEDAVWRSDDAGRTWARCEGPKGRVVGIHFDQTSPAARRVCFAGTAQGVWRSDDGGQTWARKSAGLPEREVRSFAGASSAKAGKVMLYCTVPSQAVNGQFTGGIYRSADRGESWQWSMGAGLNMETKAFDEWSMGSIAQYERIVASNADPDRVYAFNSNTGVPPPHHATCYRSDDGGKTWRATFQGDPRFPGCNVEKSYTVLEDGQYYQGVPYVACAASDPNVLITLDNSNCYLTTDGGKSWFLGHTRMAPGSTAGDYRWICNGLVVTTTWNYYVDPFQPDRHYICYTDIGFARSLDRAKTWKWWSLKGRAPWSNTCYQLAFDPQQPGLIWGAFSNVHDIPNGNIIYEHHSSRGPGGVCVSTDFGATWTRSNEGLPVVATTSVVVDPKSPRGSRTLYAGQFGQGVSKSTDNGRTWKPCNNGLGAPSNMRVTRVYLHPDGTLFALVTARREGNRYQAEGVGLYRSRDAGASWQLVNRAQPLFWPKDFTVDPRNSRILYLSAADANGEQQGGLYRTTDGGATWSKLTRQGPQHFGAFLNPRHPGWIYATLTEDAPGCGLWLSKDNGATWKPLTGLPFSNAQRVAFDPTDPARIYVTTFGGSVWRGPED